MVNYIFQTFMIKVIVWKPNIHQSLKNLIQKKQMNGKINKRCQYRNSTDSYVEWMNLLYELGGECAWTQG